jgi:hypothetical protein
MRPSLQRWRCGACGAREVRGAAPCRPAQRTVTRHHPQMYAQRYRLLSHSVVDARLPLYWHFPFQLSSSVRVQSRARCSARTRLQKLQSEQPHAWSGVSQGHQQLQLSLYGVTCTQLARRCVVGHAAVQAVGVRAEAHACGIVHSGGRESGRERCSMQRAAVLAFLNHSAHYKNKPKHPRFFSDKITLSSQFSTGRSSCPERQWNGQ